MRSIAGTLAKMGRLLPIRGAETPIVGSAGHNPRSTQCAKKLLREATLRTMLRFA